MTNVTKANFDSSLKALRSAMGLNSHAQRVVVYLMNKLVSNIEAKGAGAVNNGVTWSDVNAEIRGVLNDQAIPLWARRALARWLRRYGKIPVDALEPFDFETETINDVVEIREARSRVQSKWDNGELPEVLTTADKPKNTKPQKETKSSHDYILDTTDRMLKRVNKDNLAEEKDKLLAFQLFTAARNPATITPAKGTLHLGFGSIVQIDSSVLGEILDKYRDKITTIA